MRHRTWIAAASLCLTLALPLALGSRPAHAGGAVLLSGHDPDFHAQYIPAAFSYFTKAMTFVRQGRPGKFLLIQGFPGCTTTSNSCAPGGFLNPKYTLTLMGFVEGIHYDTVGALAIPTVDFSLYAFILVPSDFGGLLRQVELDALNARSHDVIAYINSGGGVLALAESGVLAPLRATHFKFLPFVVTAVPRVGGSGNVVTPFGASLGFTTFDVNEGCCSHNIFADGGGMLPIDIDPAGGILSLGWLGNVSDCGVDGDGDGVGDDCDICPFAPDPDQADSDSDGFGDACDVCPLNSDPGQQDTDGDGIGDACDGCVGPGGDPGCTPPPQPPEAVCRDAILAAGDGCVAADACLNGGSFARSGTLTSISASPGSPYPLGYTTVELTVVDSYGASDTCMAAVNVVDVTPPSLVCPGDVVAATCLAGGADVDLEDPIVGDNCDADVNVTGSAPSHFGVGTTEVRWHAEDDAGNDATCSTLVTVVDSSGPVVVARPMTTLWPPNHEYRTISIEDCVLSASDACSPGADLMGTGVFVSVSSDEAEDSTGDGAFLDDALLTCGARTVQVRSERQGGGNGRVYTLTARFTDPAGNAALATCLVGVPHDGSGAAPIDDILPLYAEGCAATCPEGDPDADGLCGAADNCPLVNNAAQIDGDGDGLGDACDGCVGPGGSDPDLDGDCDIGDVCAGDGCDVDPDGDIPAPTPPPPLPGDADGDGVCNDVDLCVDAPDTSQLDSDVDGRGDACDVCPYDAADDGDGDGFCADADNCPLAANPTQTDGDGDGQGDACDPCAADPDDDTDADGVCGDVDNCPLTANPAQADADADGVGDACDLCPSVADPAQTDGDADGIGDACDACPTDAANDTDGDGHCAGVDNCPDATNPTQLDSDGDGAGDACDPCPFDPLDDADADGHCADVDNCPTIHDDLQTDTDGDGRGDVCDICILDPADDADADGRCADADNCPAIANGDQANADGDAFGDACDACPFDAGNDADGDGLCAGVDNCPTTANPGQENGDGDAFGDACDACPSDPINDADGDGLCANVDNCPTTANPSQANADGDVLGDACDACPTDASNDGDGDGICGAADNCPTVANASQADADGDALGDACDACPIDPSNDGDGDGVCGAVDNCPTVANAAQTDDDGDGIGEACDPCPGDPLNDADGDGDCDGTAPDRPGDNRPPEITSTPATAAGEGHIYYYPALADDPDGDTLSWSLSAAPPGMTVNPDTGLIQWTPGSTAAGLVPVVVRVEDSLGLFDEQAYELTVGGANTAPRFLSSPITVGVAGTTYTYPIVAADPDDAILTWALTGPAGMAVSAAGVVTWPIPAGTVGNFPVTLIITDGGGATATQSYSIGVGAPGDTVAPAVTIHSPADQAEITAAAPLVVSVTDTAVASWNARACRTWGGDECFELVRGSGPLVSATITTINPLTLVDGTWTIVVSAFDAAGNGRAAGVGVIIASHGKLGAIRLVFPQFTVRAEGVELTVNLIYDGLNRIPGDVGNGWFYEWSMGHGEVVRALDLGWIEYSCGAFGLLTCVSPAYDHPVRLQLPDGRRYDFDVEFDAEPVLSSVTTVRPRYIDVSATGATLRLFDQFFTPVSTTSYDYIELSGQIFDFDFDLFQPSYAEVTTDFGEVYLFRVSDGKLLTFKDAAGLTVDLRTSTVTLEGTDLLVFATGADGMISTATDLTTGDVITYTRAANRDLVSMVDADGDLSTFTYAPGSRMISHTSAGLAPDVYEYDETGRVVRHITGDGVVTSTEYDDAARRVLSRDAAGNVVVTEYDAGGNVTKVIDPLLNETTFTYVPGTNLRASVTNPEGETTAFEYDSQRRKTLIRDPLGHEIAMAYDATSGRMTEVTDGEGRVFREDVDAEGRVTGFVLPDGSLARTFSYPAGDTIASVDGLGFTTSEVRDGRGRVTERIDSFGRAWTNDYDDVAHTVLLANPDGVATSATLDRLGRFTSLGLTEGGTIEYEYGPTGMVDQVTTPDGRLIHYDKDASGKLTGIQFDGARAQQTRYNALGQVAATSGPSGSTSLRYDAAGRLIESESDEGTVSYVYDDAGRPTQIASSSGRLQLYTYDDAGRVTRYDDGTGGAVDVTWDGSDRITSITDALGRRIDVTADANGRTAGVTYPGGVTVSRTYYPSDEFGDEAPIATLTGIDGVTHSFTYDVTGQIAGVTEPDGGVTTYAYDGMGRLLELHDALSRQTTFGWSAAGLDSVTSPESRVQSWTYDALGRADTWTRADSSAVDYTYTATSTITSLPSGEVHELAAFPEVGAVQDLGAPGGDLTVWSNPKGLPEFVQTGDGAYSEVVYTPEGRIGSITAATPGGAAFLTTYDYDLGGRLAAVVDPSGGTTTYGYDSADRITSIVRPNGTRTEMSYGALERPAAIRHYRGATLDREYTYGYDTRGRVVTAATPDGSFEYAYDTLSRLSIERQVSGGTGGTVIDEKVRVYDVVGNLISLASSAGTTTFSYDDDDRLLSETGPAGTTFYGYNGRGALTSISAPGGTTTYVYDDLDRLVHVTTASGESVDYAYDGTGHLLARTDAGGTRRCLPVPVTPRGGFNDCAMTYSPAGAEDPEVNVFDLTGIAAVHTPAAARYAWNALRGDVVAVTGPAGTVAGEAAYDAWGVVTATAGDRLGYGYTSERHDAVTGLVFLRARWYHPALGRFLTPDTFDGAREDPRTRNAYVYALDDAMNRTDPSGHFSLGECMSVNAIQNILNAISRVVTACLKRQITRKLFNAVAQWVTRAIREEASAILQGLMLSLIGVPAGSLEALFDEKLQALLCGMSTEWSFAGGMFEFYVPVGDCGNREGGLNLKNGKTTPFDCSTYQPGLKVKGVDIVVGEKLPVELKRWIKTVQSAKGYNQLVRYCRFGASQQVHTTLYAYVDMPTEDQNKHLAEICWGCWGSKGQQYVSGSCPGTIGSIYIAVGVNANDKDTHLKGWKKYVYVPDPSICGL